MGGPDFMAFMDLLDPFQVASEMVGQDESDDNLQELSRARLRVTTYVDLLLIERDAYRERAELAERIAATPAPGKEPQ